MQLSDHKTLTVLIQLFEASTQIVCGIDDTRLRGITSWKLKDLTKEVKMNRLRDWVQQVGYSKIFESTVNGMTQYVHLSVDSDDQQKAHYCCDQSPAIRSIPLSEAAVYQLDEYLFFQSIIEHLGMHPRTAKIIETYIPNLFWYIGQMGFENGSELPVYLARNIHVSYTDVIKTLFEKQCFGVVLYTGEGFPEYVTFPSGVFPLPLLDSILDRRIPESAVTPWVSTNTTLLSSPTETHPKASDDDPQDSIITIKNSHGESVLFFDRTDKILSIPGKDHWKITGTRQVAIVEYLVEKHLAGINEVKSKELLSNTQSREYGGATRIPSIFNGSARWRDYIDNTRYGYWGLNVMI